VNRRALQERESNRYFQDPIEREKGFEPYKYIDSLEEFGHARDPNSRLVTSENERALAAGVNALAASMAIAAAADVVKLAAKARIVESLSSGDVRVLASELREALEALCGSGADVISICRDPQ
jgi:hypothetical protein